MASGSAPKYARLETERRWLVEDTLAANLGPRGARRITDKYLDGGRLRLRRVESAGTVRFKLCKKYGRAGELSEPIVNTYLTEREYDALNRLPGAVVTKLRHTLADGTLDVYETDGEPLAIYEVELEDLASARRYVAPAFVTREVSGEEELSGHGLARRTEHSPGDRAPPLQPQVDRPPGYWRTDAP